MRTGLPEVQSTEGRQYIGKLVAVSSSRVTASFQTDLAFTPMDATVIVFN